MEHINILWASVSVEKLFYDIYISTHEALFDLRHTCRIFSEVSGNQHGSPDGRN